MKEYLRNRNMFSTDGDVLMYIYHNKLRKPQYKIYVIDNCLVIGPQYFKTSCVSPRLNLIELVWASVKSSLLTEMWTLNRDVNI